MIASSLLLLALVAVGVVVVARLGQQRPPELPPAPTLVGTGRRRTSAK